MVKVKRMWACVAVGGALLALLSITLGNYFGGLSIPVSDKVTAIIDVGLAFGILFICIASVAVGVVQTMFWYERKCKAENDRE